MTARVAALLFAFALQTSAQLIPVAEPLIGPDPMPHGAAGAASTRDMTMVVWSDPLCGTCVRRIGSDGTLLDPMPLRVPSMSADSIATDGQRFVIAGTRSGAFTAALLDRDGNAAGIPITLDGSPFLIAASAAAVPYAALVIRSNSSELDFVRFDRDGLRTIKKVLSSVSFSSQATAFAMNDNGVAVAISTLNFASAIDLASDTASSLGTGGADHPSIASDGSGFLAVWAHGSYPQRTIMAQQLDANGHAAGQPVTLSAPDLLYDAGPSVAWTGSEYRIAWVTNTGERYAIRSAAFSPSGWTPMLLTDRDSPIRLRTLAGANGKSFVVWADRRFETPDAERRPQTGAELFIAPAETAGDGVLLSTAPQAQEPGPVIWTGDSYLAAWREWGGASRIRFSRFANGQQLEPAGVMAPLLAQESIIDQRSPALARGAVGCAAAWLEADRAAMTANVQFALYGGCGLAAFPKLVTLSNGADPGGRVTIAFDGEQYVVAWRNQSSKWIEARRVTDEGFVIDPAPIALTDLGPTVNGDSAPLLSWNGREFLLVWQHLSSVVPLVERQPANVMAWRFTRNLTPIALPAELDSVKSSDSWYTGQIHGNYVSLAGSADGWAVLVSDQSGSSRIFALDTLGIPRRKTTIATTAAVGGVAVAQNTILAAVQGRVITIANGSSFTALDDRNEYAWNVAIGGPQPVAFVTATTMPPRGAAIVILNPPKKRRAG